jgi:hypothetical protein
LAEAIVEFETILSRTGRSTGVASDRINDFARLVIASFKRIPDSRDEVELVVDVSCLFDEIQRCLAPGLICESLPLSSIRIRIESLGRHVDRLAMSQKGGLVARFFKRFPDPSKSVVPVTIRGKSGIPDWARS